MYNRKIVFAAACAGMLIFGITLVSLGSILPQVMKQYQLEEIEAGFIATLLPFGLILGSLMFGPFVDRFGYKAFLLICTSIVFSGLELVAFGGALLSLQFGVFFIGLGGGALNGGANSMVADISTTDKGANLSLLGIFFGLGALGMPGLLGLLTDYYTYTTIFAAIGFAILLPFTSFIFIAFPEPKHSQGFPLKEGLALFRNPTILLLGAILFVQSALEGVVNNWTTTYLERGLSFSASQGLFALTMFVTGLTVMRLVLGILLKRVPSTAVLFGSIGLSSLSIIVLLNTENYSVIVPAYFCLGMGFSAFFPVILGYTGELFANFSGTAFSIVLFIGMIGNIIFIYATGALAQYFGIGKYLWLLLGFLVILALLTARTTRRITGRIKM